MFVVCDGSICVMVYDAEKRKWMYIHEDIWHKMDEAEKSKYIR